ncbi:ABC transporter ATP-binding protein [Legionella sp.]|uniref:ABC transporter ATP-binding protein n=1 Tax=Legionella sp. TaxID=459 RepID=UPI003C87E0D3
MSVLKFIFISTQPYRKYLLGMFFVVCAISLDNNVKPYLIKLLVDTACGYSKFSIWSLVYIYAGFQIVTTLAWIFSDWLHANFVPSYRAHIASILANKISYYSYAFFQNNLSGNILTKISDAFSLLPTLITTINHQFIQFGVTFFLTLLLLAKVHILFVIGLFVWILFFFLVAIIGLQKATPFSKRYAESRAKLWGYLTDYLVNILNVKLFTNSTMEKSIFHNLAENFKKEGRAQGYFLMRLYIIQGGFVSIYTISFLIGLLYLQHKNLISPGDFALVFMLNFKISDTMFELSNHLRDFTTSWGTVDQALKTLNTTPEILNKTDAIKLSVNKGEILFDKVSFQYKEIQPLFQNKNITIEAGKKIGLVGHSGGGKSTFVNLILRLFDVDEGSILIDGHDIRNVTQASLHSAIGVIPQEPSLFHRTIMENVRYGKIDASDEEVINACKQAQIHEFISTLPLGYNTIVGERGTKLSGGQRQRIAIARCILKNALILILDEATSQLDSVTEKNIQDSLWNLMQGKTTLVIAHRLSTLLEMDRVIVFDRGKIISDGTHQDLLIKSKTYKSLWSTQIGSFLSEQEQYELIARE